MTTAEHTGQTVMDSVETYLADITGAIRPLPPRQLGLADALGAVHLGLLAAAGHGTVQARPRPRVTVISTGNELVEPGTRLVPGQIWESNATMLTAAAREAGCDARRHPIVPDDTGAVLAALQD